MVSIATIGCGNGKLKYTTATVDGTITYKGKPLESGQIQFIPDSVPQQGRVPGKLAFSKIENGRYQIPTERGATVGKNRVEIVSYRETGKESRVEDSITKDTVQILPPKYNTDSTLSADVKTGANTLDFDLE